MGDIVCIVCTLCDLRMDGIAIINENSASAKEESANGKYGTKCVKSDFRIIISNISLRYHSVVCSARVAEGNYVNYP